MNDLSVRHLLGNFILALAGVMLFSALWSLGVGESDYRAILLSVVITGAVGIILRLLKPSRKDISLVESFSLVALAWILAGVFGALPFYFHGVFSSYFDALFESISGFTTTGSTLIEDVESLPQGILLWRSMTQWLGGMGIIVLFVAFLPKLGVHGVNLIKAELPGPIKDRMVPRVAQMAKLLWLIYISFTLLQVLLLLLSGVPFFLSLNHAFTTMPTGGFSPLNDSVAGLQNPMAEYIITIFMFIAGVNFTLHYVLLRGNIRTVLNDEELRFYLGVIAVSLVLVTPALTSLYSTGEAFRKGAFQVISMLTTTGYATADFGVWPFFVRALLLFSMFFGGMGGSTAGSIKQSRILLMLKTVFKEIYQLIHPTAVSSVKLNKKAVSDDILRNVAGFVSLFLLLNMISTLILSAMGLDLETALSATITSIGNVGPGLGMVGPTETFQLIPAGGRLMLAFLMIVGRLEIFTVLILFVFLTRRY